MRTGVCKHFNGIQHDCCDVGVNYRALTDDSPGFVHRLPCFTEHSRHDCGPVEHCSQFQLPSPAEVAAFEAEMEREHEEFMRVIPLIQDMKRRKGRTSCFNLGRYHPAEESHVCPRCGGLLRIMLSPNGHTHGRCDTEGCHVWME